MPLWPYRNKRWYNGNMGRFHLTEDGKRLVDLSRVVSAARTEQGSIEVLMDSGAAVEDLDQSVWDSLVQSDLDDARCPQTNAMGHRCNGARGHFGGCDTSLGHGTRGKS